MSNGVEEAPEGQEGAATVAGPGIEAECGRLLLARGWLLAVAESCTGGLLGHRLTEVQGSSAWFAGGVIVYNDSFKIGLLGVDADLIVAHGAVSAECAAAMARGALRLPAVNIALAITGIAGPTGARPGKPVGTTYIALAGGDQVLVRHYLWQGNRSQNKQSSADAALTLLHEFLTDAAF